MNNIVFEDGPPLKDMIYLNICEFSEEKLAYYWYFYLLIRYRYKVSHKM